MIKHTYKALTPSLTTSATCNTIVTSRFLPKVCAPLLKTSARFPYRETEQIKAEGENDMDFELVKLEIDGEIAMLLNDPDNLNAMNQNADA